MDWLRENKNVKWSGLLQKRYAQASKNFWITDCCKVEKTKIILETKNNWKLFGILKK